ncbi:MAG: hypothetical protein JWM09_1263 [Francisellaceae bacterium]|nr:hypothetical protein [Francisellaceae bacterium]
MFKCASKCFEETPGKSCAIAPITFSFSTHDKFFPHAEEMLSAYKNHELPKTAFLRGVYYEYYAPNYNAKVIKENLLKAYQSYMYAAKTFYPGSTRAVQEIRAQCDFLFENNSTSIQAKELAVQKPVNSKVVPKHNNYIIK